MFISLWQSAYEQIEMFPHSLKNTVRIPESCLRLGGISKIQTVLFPAQNRSKLIKLLRSMSSQFWICPRMETTQPQWTSCISIWSSSRDIFPLISICNLPPCNLFPLPPVLSLYALKKSLALSSSDQLAIDSSTLCPSASLLQAEQTQLSQPFLIWPVLPVFYQLGGLCWAHSSISILILHFRVQKRTHCSRCGLKITEQHGSLPLPCWWPFS